MSGSLPIVMTAAGMQPQAPASLQSQVISGAVALSPGLTANLPGSLIEDIASTDVAAIALCDAAAVDLVNSVTPYGANEFILINLGSVYGVDQGKGSNTSVYVVFSGTPGYTISPGFVVSDGTNQYTVQDGGIIGTNGVSLQLYCLAVNPGTFAVPANTVNQLVTSVPTGIALSATNALPGVPGAAAQAVQDYRAQVLQAGLATSTGSPTLLKTALQKIPGVQPRLVSVRLVQGYGWEVICGGGDPYQVAYAIFSSMFDLSNIIGSTLLVTGITNANPGVVTTNLNHGFVTGQVVYITGVMGMTGINGVPLTITVLSPKTFSIGIDTTASGMWTSGGVVTPNLRNITASITDSPDIYPVTFVNPPQQTVAIAATWGTSATNIISPTSVAALAQPALANYVNALPVGQPINLFELQAIFQTAVASVIATPQLTRLVFAVYINGLLVNPSTGTGIIAGDPESYFQTTPASMTVIQG